MRKGAGRIEEQVKLVNIENNRRITKETDTQFWFAYQKSILLALKDQEILTETQYRYAEEKLKKQLRTFAKKKTACNTEVGGGKM